MLSAENIPEKRTLTSTVVGKSLDLETKNQILALALVINFVSLICRVEPVYLSYYLVLGLRTMNVPENTW